MKLTHVIAVILVSVALLMGLRAVAQQGTTGQSPSAPAPAANAPDRLTYTTPNTTRLSGPNVYSAASAITQTTYGATHHEDRPHAIILVRADREADAMLAASRVTHFPVNAPVLYVDEDRLPPETLAEMKRLGPDGNNYDSNVQVYLVGAISERVEREVRDTLGYRTRAFRIDDPFALSEALDTWAADVHTQHPSEVIIVQYDQIATGLPAVAWNAHMGHGLFFVKGDTIPDATRSALTHRYRGTTFIYLFGDTSLISESVARELSNYGHVQRVHGRDAYEISVNFAAFRDSGRNIGYWIGYWPRDFGWGISEAGHNFTFVNLDDWQQAVTGSLLSHMGKHGPMILMRSDGLSEQAVRYLETLKPTLGAPGDQLNNHGWILGGTDRISWPSQADLDMLLEARDKD